MVEFWPGFWVRKLVCMIVNWGMKVVLVFIFTGGIDIGLAQGFLV